MTWVWTLAVILVTGMWYWFNQKQNKTQRAWTEWNQRSRTDHLSVQWNRILDNCDLPKDLVSIIKNYAGQESWAVVAPVQNDKSVELYRRCGIHDLGSADGRPLGECDVVLHFERRVEAVLFLNDGRVAIALKGTRIEIYDTQTSIPVLCASSSISRYKCILDTVDSMAHDPIRNELIFLMRKKDVGFYFLFYPLLNSRLQYREPIPTVQDRLESAPTVFVWGDFMFFGRLALSVYYLRKREWNTQTFVFKGDSVIVFHEKPNLFLTNSEGEVMLHEIENEQFVSRDFIGLSRRVVLLPLPLDNPWGSLALVVWSPTVSLSILRVVVAEPRAKLESIPLPFPSYPSSVLTDLSVSERSKGTEHLVSIVHTGFRREIPTIVHTRGFYQGEERTRTLLDTTRQLVPSAFKF